MVVMDAIEKPLELNLTFKGEFYNTWIKSQFFK